ncbi:MAG: TonB-dependent receptor [Bacteroidota bacterium]|jgi:TonB-dependent receptor
MYKKAIFPILLFLTPFAVFGQNALVKGSVNDQQTGAPLPGCRIQVLGSSAGTASSLDGSWQLNIPADTHNIVFAYLGYTADTVKVVLTAGETRILNVSLRPDVRQLNAVTISGDLSGQARALNQQRTADNIVNIVSSEQIGRFPDPNAAEAMQRVPGVNIERDQGEGRYVLVRGLAPKFTNVSINGEQIPSPEAGVRYVALDAVPSDQLASMEIHKSLLPDMDGDAIGGSVNLITRKAQDSVPRFSGSLVGGYNALTGQVNGQGGLQYGQRFGSRQQAGLLINLTHYQNNLGSDNWERDMNGTKDSTDDVFELRDYTLTRTRSAASLTFDYRLNSNSELYFRGMYNRFTDREWRRRYSFIPEDGEVEYELKDRFEAQGISSFNLGGRHTFPHFRFDYELSSSFAFQNTPYDYSSVFIAGVPSSVGYFGQQYPTLTAPGYLDNSQYGFDALEIGSTLAKDRNLTGKFNFSIPTTIQSSKGEIRFGAKARFKTKSYSINQVVYEAQGVIPELNYFQEASADDNFLGGAYAFSPSLSMGSMINYFNANPAQFEMQIEDKSIDEALEAFTAEENVIAGYVMDRQSFGRLVIIGGVRYEFSKVSYTSSDVVIAPNGDLQAIVPVSGNTTYGFILPQIQLRFAARERTNFRFAATRSYARPNFSEIIPAQEANLEDRVVTIGNAALKPVTATNIDLLLEHYLSNVGIISAGTFWKQLDGFIYNAVNFNQPYLGNQQLLVDIVQAQNGERANLLGGEIAYQHNLRFLPGALSGLGVYFNYTYTASAATIQSRLADSGNPNLKETITLPGQSRHLGNATLMYEYKGFSLRCALNFNGQYLSEVGTTTDFDLYVRSRMQLDATAGYTFKKFRVFAEFLNLTNQPFETFMGNENYIVQREYYSWWSRVGVKFDF